MSNAKYLIYKHISPSGKIYIGQTCKLPIRRFRYGGKGYKNQTYFYSAIEKYGWDNFKHEIICSNLTLKEANYLEHYLIMYYESYNREKGYNITLGGDNELSTIPVWNKGLSWSDEYKKKLSEICKNRKDRSKKVLCVETGIIYLSASDAGRKLNIKQSHISECRNGKRKTAGGFHWKSVEQPTE